MSARRLPTESEAAEALLAQALESGRYLTTPADEECPSGVWLLVPLDRRLVEILDLAGDARGDLEDDEREQDQDDEPELGATNGINHEDAWANAHLSGDDDEIDEASSPDWLPWMFPPSEEIAP
ncbi:hypothetical protein [Reyranella sp.]|jgi:hypothetical protein|uniref:hypothetical protein n=1 Tax=Reyranella sp. TaxID=1929291 RepID=UPI000BDBC333|nr:hypothetical protein [Reyranella sp.]OYY40460.1 MAG: hypothetical protein B7Y57_17270 [Rhodospirillales bacterium 35-66-84]OYZ93077.1 MAG: hypothetical protein B7Y08_18520 [Rhodospirillales bacterium 24-66-33]OZB24205.1 MAG: hypothetical protein B7X63_16480 [Rhodospirillales bacterium 39-66-50]HQS18801.1 hypothetical protein [Reyranella sp.]HQT14890.1 hypothetical protein [Reyranella sp.]